MPDENKSPLSDILPIMRDGDAKNKYCFLTGNACSRALCMAWKTVVEYDYTDDPKKEEPVYTKVARTETDLEVYQSIRAGDYTIKFDKFEIEWEKIKVDGVIMYRRPRHPDDRLGYCMKLVE